MSREGGYQANLGWTRTIILELELKKLCVSLLTVTLHLLVLKIWGRSAQGGLLSHLARNYREASSWEPTPGAEWSGRPLGIQELNTQGSFWIVIDLKSTIREWQELSSPASWSTAESTIIKYCHCGYNIWYTVTVGHWVKRMHRPECLKAEVQSGQTVGRERLLPSTRVLFNNFKGNLLLWETKLKIN